MAHKLTAFIIILLTMISGKQSFSATPNACELITKNIVEQSSGLKITNVTAKDRGAFTSCTFETDNWQVNVGLIFYPGGKADMDSAALAKELQKEFDRDQAPYKKPEPLADLGDAAAYYQSADGDYHAIVLLNSNGHARGRLIVSAHTRDATLAVANAVLKGK